MECSKSSRSRRWSKSDLKKALHFSNALYDYDEHGLGFSKSVELYTCLFRRNGKEGNAIEGMKA
uniref:Uncharacterized protein n=1 Tax=Romanomermis culicivorax TaxID=13658 RepID=A0A915KYU2_ROMCU